MEAHSDTPSVVHSRRRPLRASPEGLLTVSSVVLAIVSGAPLRAAGQPPAEREGRTPAQETAPPSPPGDTPARALGPAERMAAGLPPFDLPAFGLGAAITLSTPGAVLAVGSISATYDLGPVHFDALFGLLWDDAGPNALSGSLRGYVLIHRGPIADFSLGLGGGLGYIEQEDGSTDLTWQLTAGAKIRAFIGGKNAAVSATIGGAAAFVDDTGVVVVGGRLLGSAGFVYFFR